MLQLRSLARMLGRPLEKAPRYGVLMQSTVMRYILAVDSFAGREDVIVKPITDVKPKGVAGVTLASDGSVVLVLEMEALLATPHDETRDALFGATPVLARAA